ncbi:hypothetical protein [Herbaspirillum robiniae]|uniref:Uncharacterized protein n=1 Tax=Herbaspirillum robiniae TaxID=2014887 RepID=A0A246WR83_9BURK|nr:hypothetical protein [Herbaspirillum robiniae]NUU01962.1 hypothetical protein [Herbaspirillum robiniae]OWY28911.1 hypothetical protein CEJ42_13175 [Herbaspirillum robiniae]
MTKKIIISAALLAAAAFGSAAYAQSYDQGGYGYQTTPQQQYDSSAPQYYNYQGDQTTSPAYSQDQGQNGQYVDHSSTEMRAGQPNNYARDMKDGPMGTSPGS